VLSDFADGTTLSAKGGRTSILAETVLTALHTLGIPTAVAGTPGSARMTIRAAHDLVIVRKLNFYLALASNLSDSFLVSRDEEGGFVSLVTTSSSH